MLPGIAHSCSPPQRPMLRRLVDIVPAPAPTVTPLVPDVEPAPDFPAPDPTAPLLAERVLRAAVEVLGHRRPARQLAGLLRPALLSYLLSVQRATGHLDPRVRKVLCSQHTAGAVEAVALLTLRTGVRALAARFEKRLDGEHCRWQCTALQLRLTPGDLVARRWRVTGGRERVGHRGP